MEWNSMHGRVSRQSLGVCAALALSAILAACGGDKPSATGGEGGAGAEGGSSSTGTGGTGGTGGDGGMGGMPLPKDPEFVAKFDPGLGQLPEGIAIDGEVAYVSYSVDPKVVKVNLVTGEVTDFGKINAPIGIGFPQGVALDKQKNVYVAVVSTDPPQFKPGIYKIAPSGGDATLFASTPAMSYPRQISFDSKGNGFVSAPTAATIFVLSPDGQTITSAGVAQPNSGDQTSMCAFGMGMPYGVTSTFLTADDAFFMTNGDRASVYAGQIGLDMGGNLIAVPGKDPMAGPDCENLGGAEGIIEDSVDLSLLVAVRKKNRIARVQYTGAVTPFINGTNLYEPSAMAIAVVGGKRYLYIVNSASASFQTGGIPSIVKLELGGVQ